MDIAQKSKPIEIGQKDQVEYSVIWLHGLGADGSDFVPIVPELKLPNVNKIHFVFPNAPIRPVSLNAGMPFRAWFDIYNLDDSGPIDEEGIHEAVDSIHQLIQEEINSGIPSDHIFLAGFSQGGYVALLSGLYFPQPLAGLIGLSTFLWKPQDFEQKRQSANQKTPIFLAHGRDDMLLSLEYGDKAANHLKNAGYNVSYQVYPIAHTVSLEEIADLSQWLKRLLKQI